MAALEPSHPVIQPLTSFYEFWRATFGRAVGHLDIPADMVDSLQIMRRISTGFDVPGLVDTQASVISMSQAAAAEMPAAAQSSASNVAQGGSRSPRAPLPYADVLPVSSTAVGDAHDAFGISLRRLRGGSVSLRRRQHLERCVDSFDFRRAATPSRRWTVPLASRRPRVDLPSRFERRRGRGNADRRRDAEGC